MSEMSPIEAVEHYGGVGKAAEALGVSRTTMSYRVKKEIVEQRRRLDHASPETRVAFICDGDMAQALVDRARAAGTTVNNLLLHYIEWGLENDGVVYGGQVL